MNIGTTVLISAVSLLVIGIGAYIAYIVGKKHNSSEDWMVGGRSLPVYVVGFSQAATAVGGGVLVAHVGIAYSWGLSIFWYELFVVLGMLIIVLFARWLHKGNFSTIPEVFARLFGDSKTLLAIIAVAVILVPFGWLATQFVAFASLFGEVTGIATTPLIIVMAVISVLFVLPGGLTSVAWSDFFFGVFMVIGSVVVAGYAIYQAGGLGEIVSNVPAEITAVPEGFGAAGVMTILLWAFSILPGTVTNQMYYQRIFASKTVRQGRQGIYIAAAGIILAGFYALIIGLAVRSMNGGLGVENREQAAGWFLGQIPAWLLAIYGAFLMATIVSTTGSALQSVVANLVHDLRNAFVSEKRLENSNMVTVSRWCTIAVTLVAALLAVLYPQALELLVATYAYSASVLAVPLICGMILIKRGQIPVMVSYLSMAAGLLGCAIAHVMGTEIPYAIYGIVASLIVFIIAYTTIKPKNAQAQTQTEPQPEPASQNDVAATD
ncbi:sodium:solute symporter family protein [Corynebacterium casei]|uniref:sodium:solute symporter family protein n=1 Tax=Corynebacterium casei TaxID=160386 RepID=UPI003F915846